MLNLNEYIIVLFSFKEYYKTNLVVLGGSIFVTRQSMRVKPGCKVTTLSPQFNERVQSGCLTFSESTKSWAAWLNCGKGRIPVV